jgi:hypothetical protein
MGIIYFFMDTIPTNGAISSIVAIEETKTKSISGLDIKKKIPKPKHQITNKFQIIISKSKTIVFLSLEF